MDWEMGRSWRSKDKLNFAGYGKNLLAKKVVRFFGVRRTRHKTRLHRIDDGDVLVVAVFLLAQQNYRNGKEPKNHRFTVVHGKYQ